MIFGRFATCRVANVLKWLFTILIFSLLLLKGVIEEQLESDVPRRHSFADRKLHRRSIISKEIEEKIIDLGQSLNQPSAKTDLLTLIRQCCLDPPSTDPYNLKENPPIDVKYVRYKQTVPSWMFIRSVVKDLFAKRARGFFVEAGASDGEHLSNTLPLEKRSHWTGLLVEVETKNYMKLRRKNRRAWSAPVCLATEPHPHRVVLSTFSRQIGWLRDEGAARIRKNSTIDTLDSTFYETFQNGLCIPAQTILEALGVTHVDFFSLDVEGVEMDILHTFPFDRITVDVWAIEHFRPTLKGAEASDRSSGTQQRHESEDEKLIAFMENKGFYFFDMFCCLISDYIFIRRDSAIFKELQVPPKFWKRRGICLEKGDFIPDFTFKLEEVRDRRHWPVLKFKGSPLF